jgi:hypothetical protein
MRPRGKRSSIGICIPTSRPERIPTFLEMWTPILHSDVAEDRQISLFIHEDRKESTLTELVQPPGVRLVVTCQAEINTILGSHEWIIPRNSGACRSFPMYLAWKAGCDFIVTLDDDCHPERLGSGDFIKTHLAAFELDRWFRTIGDADARGVPYGERGSLPVLLNHGLWTDVPDLDAPTSLQHQKKPISVVLRACREVVPPGQWFTLCGMNVCYRRAAIPAAYNLLMGQAYGGIDRFDDIWSGLFLKKIADHLGLYITSGVPFVRHSRASDPFVNLRKEALGIHLHEYFWRHIAAAELHGVQSIAASYRELALCVRAFPTACPEAPCPPNYFEHLAEAMGCWLELFEESPLESAQ